MELEPETDHRNASTNVRYGSGLAVGRSSLKDPRLVFPEIGVCNRKSGRIVPLGFYVLIRSSLPAAFANRV